MEGRAAAPSPSTDGRLTSATKFTIPAGRMLIVVRAKDNGAWEGAEIVTQAPVTGTLDLGNNTFSLTASGQDSSGNAIELHLRGHIVNHPPTAAASGPAKPTECTSPEGAKVTLSASGSTDPDPNDHVTHYQWFHPLGTGDDGALARDGNSETVTVQAPLGTTDYTLHVYDHVLGSGETTIPVTVRDTTPPHLTDFAYTGPLCLWPPNHKWVVVRTNRDLSATVKDTCDPSPKLEIVGAESNQPATGRGSGNTSPDVFVRPDHVCLRAERQGSSSTPRVYKVYLMARDASGNEADPTITVEVRHDQRGKAKCHMLPGVEVADDGDPRCTAAP